MQQAGFHPFQSVFNSGKISQLEILISRPDYKKSAQECILHITEVIKYICF